MSLKDLKLEFSNKQAVTGTSATSTNKLDLGLETNNLSGNVHGGGYLNVQCCKNIAPAENTVTIKLQDSDNGTDFTDVAGASLTFVKPLKGTQGCLRIPTVKRYVQVSYSATTSLTDGKWDAYIGAPIAKH